MNTIAIIQARMRSARLPGKVMLPLGGKPVLQHVVERTRQACDQVIVSTGNQEQNEPILMLCKRLEVPCWASTGDENDVVSRFRSILQSVPCDAFLRVTADCPLAEPRILAFLMRRMGESGVDYINAANQAGYADGIGAEIVNTRVFMRLTGGSLSVHEREHVTPVLYAKSTAVPFGYTAHLAEYVWDPTKFRLTLDTQLDYERLQMIWEELGPKPTARGAIDWLRDNLRWLNSA